MIIHKNRISGIGIKEKTTVCGASVSFVGFLSNRVVANRNDKSHVRWEKVNCKKCLKKRRKCK